MTEMDDLIRRLHLDTARQEEDHIQSALRFRLGYTARVTIRKPLWMPEFVYRRLMRTIIVETLR